MVEDRLFELRERSYHEVQQSLEPLETFRLYISDVYSLQTDETVLCSAEDQG